MGETLDGGTKSCCKAPGTDDKGREDGEMNGMRDLPPPKISRAVESMSTLIGTGTGSGTVTGTKPFEVNDEREECTLFTMGI